MRYNHHQVYMRRRHQQEGGTRWSVVIKTFAFLVVGVSLALFYVWQNVQLVRVGYQVKDREKKVTELSKRTKALEIDISMLKMPSHIISKIKEGGLNLNIPEIWQIVKIQEEPILYEDDLINLNLGYEEYGSHSLIDVVEK